MAGTAGFEPAAFCIAGAVGFEPTIWGPEPHALDQTRLRPCRGLLFFGVFFLSLLYNCGSERFALTESL
jgi:hypothetical protein